MTDLQAWVNRKYPTQEEKEQVRKLDLSELSLEGELDLSDFRQLDQIFISPELASANLTFKNKPQGVEIIKLQNAHATFKREFPQAGACRGEFDTQWTKNQGLTRTDITKIDLSNKNLEGPLVIENFPKLKKIDLSENCLTSLTFLNCPVLTEVVCHGNLLTELPSFSAPCAVTKLDIASCCFKGILNLSQFPNLKKLDCSYSQLTNLKLNNCPNLTELYCSTSKLTELTDFSQLRQLRVLRIDSNQFTGSLAPLANLANLEHLTVSFNQFTNSFVPLQNLTKLTWLNICGTNLSTSLEYLPRSLEKLKYDDQQFQFLKNYWNYEKRVWKLDSHSHWRDHNRELIKLLITTDQLTDLQTKVTEYFIKQTDFISQWQQLSNTEWKIKINQYWAYLALLITAIGSIISGYYSVPGGYLAGFASLISLITSYWLNEYLTKQLVKIRKRWGSSEEQQHNTIDQFITRTAELETNYQKLLTIFTDCSTLTSQPTLSETLNCAFSKWLAATATFREQLLKVEKKELERGHRIVTAVQFSQTFQASWKSLNRTIQQLIREATQYRTEMYSLNSEIEIHRTKHAYESIPDYSPASNQDFV